MKMEKEMVEMAGNFSEISDVELNERVIP